MLSWTALGNLKMVTNVQPFGVSSLISISGQRWSEMFDSPMMTPMFAFERTEDLPEHFFSFHAGAIARLEFEHGP
jgi:hypothetical protein